MTTMNGIVYMSLKKKDTSKDVKISLRQESICQIPFSYYHTILLIFNILKRLLNNNLSPSMYIWFNTILDIAQMSIKAL